MSPRAKLVGLTALLVACRASPPAPTHQERAVSGDGLRHDLYVVTTDGIHVFVREVRPAKPTPHAEPIVLVHGARVPGLASFDLAAPGGSLATDLAASTGRTVYVMDARGYGASDRPPSMDRLPAESAPIARAREVVRDLAAVVREAERRSGTAHVALFGWATGGMWASYYASLEPEHVAELISLNALYGGSDRHAMLGRGSSTSDPEHPDRVSPALGAYATYEAPSLFGVWDKSIPDEDKSAWRDPAIAEAYANAAMASDPTSAGRRPPSFRAPLGAIEDSFYQANGRRLFDASTITSRVLLIRSERDFWSRREDVDAFAHDAAHATSLRTIELPGATHFVHLERPVRGRDRLLDEVARFLAEAH